MALDSMRSTDQGEDHEEVPVARGLEPGPELLRVRELVLADDLDLCPADIALVHREALRVLRPGIDTATLDAYSDEAWPPEVLPSYELLLALAREAVANGSRSRKGDLGMAMDIDVRDDDQFELLLDLAPYAIGAEGRRGDCVVFGASDTGTALVLVVTREQEAELLDRLSGLGIPSTVLAQARRRRRGWWRRRPR